MLGQKHPRAAWLVEALCDVGGLQPGETAGATGDIGELRRLGHFAIGAGLVIGAIAGAILGVLHAIVHLQNDPLNDIPTFYVGAQRLNAGETLYPPGADPDRIPYYFYPPLLAILLRPFALLPYPIFAALWEAGTILVFVLFVRRLGFNRRTAIALGLLGGQIADVLSIGQSQAHIAWLLSLGSPFAIALAGQIKIFPALVALYWLGRRDWRKLGWFVAWSVALVLLQVVLEPRESLAFVRGLGLQQVGTYDQLSPYAFAPWLWFGLVVAFLVITPLVARTRFGWAAAVAFSSLVYPRLFGYHLLSLGAALKPPDDQPKNTAITRRPPGSG